MPTQLIEIEFEKPLTPISEEALRNLPPRMKMSYYRHTFKLGLGSCGRVVTALDAHVSNGVFEVIQTCEDNPDDPDYFGYPLHTIRRYKVYQTDDPTPAKCKH